jgi:teichoic acid transport system ATP-binding protein
MAVGEAGSKGAGAAAGGADVTDGADAAGVIDDEVEDAVDDLGIDLEPAPRAVSDEVSILLRKVHVTYRAYAERRINFRDFVGRGFEGRRYRAIRAVRGVSLEIYTGEAVGIIGPNGSGKSTLMQAIAGLLPVTKGAVYARHQPAFLGVGAALKPALSGRRNVYIGGLALGLSRDQIERRFDAIVAFAGLGDFIDLPMKTYSSGMRARLQFAIATAVTPKILLIDEALAVGDRQFRRRSMRKLREIRNSAGTVVLVSHSLGEVQKSCSRVIWLQKGTVVMDGPAEAVVTAYRDAQDRTDPDAFETMIDPDTEVDADADSGPAPEV